MKRLVLAVGLGGLLALVLILVIRQKSTLEVPAPEPLQEQNTITESTTPAEVVSANPTPATRRDRAPVVSVITPQSSDANPPPLDEATIFRQTLDLLVSPQASFEQKQAAWQQLRQDGKLDRAIAELEQAATNHPTVAEYPAALGQAYLHKCATSPDVRDQGILAMKADQIFDAALALDPANWEAGFFKASSLSYWPKELNKGTEVIQRFTQLIEQQEATAAQPHFAQSYVWLGEQYQKAGRADYAQQVWQRGAALFPADSALQKKLAAQP